MIQDIQNLLSDYHSWLKDRTVLRQIGVPPRLLQKYALRAMWLRLWSLGIEFSRVNKVMQGGSGPHFQFDV